MDFFLHDGQQGLKLGPCLTIVAPAPLDLPTTSKQDADASEPSAQKLGDKAAPPAFKDTFESQQLSTYLSGAPPLQPRQAGGVQEGTGQGGPAGGPAPAAPGEVTLVMAPETTPAAGAQQRP